MKTYILTLLILLNITSCIGSDKNIAASKGEPQLIKNNNTEIIAPRNDTEKFCDSLSIDDEYQIINTLLPQLYHIRYCNQVREKLLALKKYDTVQYNRIKHKYFFSEIEIDTIKKFVRFWHDSLTQIDITQHRAYILSKFDSLSNEYKYFKELECIKKDIEIDNKKIIQDGVEFTTKAIALEKGYPERFGKNETILHLGLMGFTRVYYSKIMNVGFFHYGYLGGSTCGYTEYIVFTKENEKWKVVKKIDTGVF
ncbi:MAG: hypothetical protein PF481_05030 [Bacteroidales bacterium]|jgi:hypothetical protein|nr:hypothetical protein [Bacteroidales bacterium]